MELTLLNQLKQKLLHDKDLSKVWAFYMDEFADIPEFVEFGQPGHNDFLAAVVPQLCQQLVGKTLKMDNVLLIQIAEHQFFHAPLLVGGRIGGVIYFEDINIGLIAMSAEPPLVKYSRFSSSPRINETNFHDYN
jgi:hypothetical protein